MGRGRVGDLAAAVRLVFAGGLIIVLGMLTLPAVAVADPAATTTALSPSPSDPLTNQLATLTATVTSDSGTAVGTITFDEGGNAIPDCPPVALDGTTDTGTCQTQFAAGTVTANFTPSDSTLYSPSSASVTIGQDASTTTLVGPGSSRAGQTESYTVTVAPTDTGPNEPTGAVSLTDSGKSDVSCSALNPGASSSTATCSVTFVSAGTHSLTASWAGDGNFNGSASAPGQDVTVATAPTTTSLSAAPDAAVTNQPVTLTAKVAGNDGAGTPTGSVKFDTDQGPMADCSSQRVGSDGTATCVATFTADSPPGPVTATYVPDSSSPYAGSTSSPATSVTVAPAATTTTLSGPSTSQAGSTESYAVTVTPAYAPGVEPSGTISLSDTGTSKVSCAALSAGGSSSTATCSVTFVSAGTHSLTASYGGDRNFNSSTSTPAEDVTVATAPTTTSLSVVPNPAVTNQPVILTAKVAGNDGAGTPTGWIHFDTAHGPIADCLPRPVGGDGTATCVAAFTADSPPGPVTATYVPDSNSPYAGSTSSPPTSINIAPAGTTTTLSGPAAGRVGSAAAYTVTVTPLTGPGVEPSGPVTLLDASGASVGSCDALSNASSSCTVKFTSDAAGQTLQAHYGGDSNFAGSDSSASPVTVSGAPSTTSLKSDNATAVTNQAVTLTATVSGQNGTPKGTVSFDDGGHVISGCGQEALDMSGVATCHPAFNAGQHSLGATYTPTDTVYAPSPAPAGTTVTVSPDSTSTALKASNASPQTGHSVSYTATVTPDQNGPIEPTGQVRFLDEGNAIAGCEKQQLNPGASASTATCTLTYGASGSHSISASYLGDSNFKSSPSAPVAVVVPQTPVAATTLSAGSVTATTAVLRGAVNTLGAAVTWQFQYGRVCRTPCAYSATKGGSTAAGLTTAAVSAPLTGLTPATTYHYQLIAVQPALSFGRDVTFTTQPLGKLLLSFSSLRSTAGTITVPLACQSSRPCTGRISIATNARHPTQCSAPAYSVPAGKLKRIAARLSQGCNTLARRNHNRLSVAVRSSPTSHQLPASKVVTLTVG